MIRILALGFLVIASAQDKPESLRIRQFQIQQWFGGPARKDLRFMSCEQVRLSFQIEGLTLREDKLHFDVKLTLLKEDQPYFEEVVSKVNEVDWFGKRASAGVVYFMITDEKPGTYKARIELTDLHSESRTTREFEFQVVPVELKIANMRLSYDVQGTSNAPPIFQVFQPVVALFDIVGLEVKDGAVDVTGDVYLLDERGRRLHGMTDVYKYAGELENGKLPGNFRIHAGVPGEYQLEVVIRDKNRAKPNETKLRVPIRIVESLQPAEH